MSPRRGVCLVRFDDKTGPDCVYQQGLDTILAKKVSVKSHLSTMSLSTSYNIDEEFIESVIPFIDEGFIAYSNFFFVKDKSARGGKRTLGIVTLVDRSEQMSLYKSIPEISATVKAIASDIAKMKNPLGSPTDQIKAKLTELLHMESLAIDFDQEVDSIKLIKERLDREEKIEKKPITNNDNLLTEGSFEFLFSRITSGVDKIIYALLRNEHVVVFGEESEITLTLATLRWFLPHKKLYNDLWTVPLVDAEALFSRSSDSTTLHVLGIQSESFFDIINSGKTHSFDLQALVGNQQIDSLTLEDPLETKLIVDIEKGEVHGGITNRFCTRIVDSLQTQNFDNVIRIITENIDYLLERVFDLIYLILENPSKVELEQFIVSSIEGEISLLATILADTNPLIFQTLLEAFANYQLTLDVLF